MTSFYKCLSCGNDIEHKDVTKKVRCPFCGHRIIRKKRSEVSFRKVMAI